MRERSIAVLAASVALCALYVANDASAFGRGGGAGLGGGGFNGFATHSFAVHGVGSYRFGGYRSAGHVFGAHSFGGRGFSGYGNVQRFSARRGLAGGLKGSATHNQFGGSNRVAGSQYASTQVAARFHGLSNFNGTGFNRNAFGNGQAWNGWGHSFWGAGWSHWGWGWGGWAGPVFWPFVFGDIFSFAFWPYDYYDPFWAFGPEFVLVSIFWPGPYYWLDYGYAPDYYEYEGSIYYYGGSGGVHRAPNSSKDRRIDRLTLTQARAQAVQSCSGLAPGVTDLPVEQMRRTIHPTEEQAAALDDLSAASSKANDIVEASCPKNIPLTPVGRLDSAEKRLDAMIQAIQIVRSPLEKFYGSLNDEQRQRFDAMPGPRRADGARVSPATSGNLATMCSQQGGGFTKVPVQRIEQVVEPTAQQQGALDDLKKAAENAAEKIQASCPTQMPQTPMVRLDAVETRLNAMVEAMKNLRPKLEDFYASLGDEQKAKFNTMGAPLQNASAQPQHQGSGQ